MNDFFQNASRRFFGAKKPEPVTYNSVAAAPPPRQSVEQEREKVGLQILRQVTLTAVSAANLREELVKKVSMELRGP